MSLYLSILNQPCVIVVVENILSLIFFGAIEVIIVRSISLINFNFKFVFRLIGVLDVALSNQAAIIFVYYFLMDYSFD